MILKYIMKYDETDKYYLESDEYLKILLDLHESGFYDN